MKFRIGETDLPYSYIKYLVDYYFNTDSNPVVIDYITAISFILSLLISVYLNLFNNNRHSQSDSHGKRH